MENENKRYIAIDNNYYLFSEDVKVYPNINRGKKQNNDSTPDIPINPESLLYTEFNITNAGGYIGQKADGFYLSQSNKIIELNEIEYSILVINGYTFLLNKDTIDGLLEIDNTSLFACIKIQNVNLTDEYLPNSSTDVRPAETKILISTYSTQTQTEGNNSVVQTITTEPLDIKLTSEGTTATVFTGLKFTTVKPSDTDGYKYLDIKSTNAQFTVSTNEIDNESITSAKLGADLIETEQDDDNGIIVKLSESTIENADGHKLNIGIVSKAVTNAQKLTDENGTTGQEAGQDVNNAIGLIKFTDGKPVNITKTSGNSTTPVYVNNGKIVPITFTLGNNKLIKISSGKFSDDTTTNCGGSSKPIYINGGTITASNSTIGSTNKPVYMYQGNITPITKSTTDGRLIYFSSGTITESNKPIGSATKPIFVDAGTIKQSNGTVAASLSGDGTYSPICLENGELKTLSETSSATDKTVGAYNKPIYLAGGKFKPLVSDYGIGGDYRGVYLDNTGTIKPMNGSTGGALQPVYLDNGVITAGTQLYNQSLKIGENVIGPVLRTTGEDINVALGTGITYSNGIALKTASTDEIGGVKVSANSSIPSSDDGNEGSIYLDGNGVAKYYYTDHVYTQGDNITISTSGATHTVKLNKSLTNMTSISGASAGGLSISNVGSLTMNGTLTGATINITGQCKASNFYATSDERLKENIEDFKYDRSILDLPIKTFDFKDGAKNQIGCLAQDLQQIYPELVTEDDKGYLAIQENKLVYLLLEEVKQLKQEIAELKKKDRN